MFYIYVLWKNKQGQNVSERNKRLSFCSEANSEGMEWESLEGGGVVGSQEGIDI